jgi:hypothetical protein
MGTLDGILNSHVQVMLGIGIAIHLGRQNTNGALMGGSLLSASRLKPLINTKDYSGFQVE